MRQLSVIMLHGEVQSINPSEIVRIENVLSANSSPCRRPEIGLEHGQDRLQHVDAWQACRSAPFLEPPRKLLVHHRIKDDARLFLNPRAHLLQMLFGTDQGVDVLDRARVLVLRGCRTPRRKERLASGVGNQVKMEETLLLLHTTLPVLWTAVDSLQSFAWRALALG